MLSLSIKIVYQIVSLPRFEFDGLGNGIHLGRGAFAEARVWLIEGVVKEAEEVAVESCLLSPWSLLLHLHELVSFGLLPNMKLHGVLFGQVWMVASGE